MVKKKISIRDITIPEHHRSIQDISMADVGREENGEIKSKKKAVGQRPSVKKVVLPEDDVSHFDFHSEYITHHHKPRWGMVSMWFLAIIILIGGFIFASSFFHSARVDIKIKEAISEVDTSVNMVRKDDTGVLPFEIVSLSKEVSESVPAKGEKQVSVKATGRIIIYNKNTTSQKLLAQTRLETPSGKIYKLTSTVTVAGAKKTVPGSLEVTATADAPGAEYNSDLVDLAFVGFKGTAKYETVYARSKTPFTGGILGTIKVAENEDLIKAQDSIKNSLTKQLISGAGQQIPNSFVLLPDVYSIHYSSSTQVTKDDVLSLKQKADFVGVLVDVKKISMFLAKKSIPGYSGEDITVSNLSDLSFEFASSSNALNVNTDSITLNIKGKPHFIYGYDAEKLRGDLAGISRESFATVIATYGAIEKGDSKILPFWRSKFPTDTSKITINEEK
jgi:hypothetical protein